MDQLNFHNSQSNNPLKLSLSLSGNLSIIQRLQEAYKLWYGYFQILAKTHRYSLGIKIDNIFIEIIESTSFAYFLQQNEKLPYIRLSIKKLETLKILIMILWENKSLENNKYILLSTKLTEIGKILGGWYGKLQKQNSSAK